MRTGFGKKFTLASMLASILAKIDKFGCNQNVIISKFSVIFVIITLCNIMLVTL